MTQVMVMPAKRSVNPALLFAGIIAVVGVCVAVGWAEGIGWLKRPIAGETAVEASTAIDLVLTGVAVCLLSTRSKAARIAGRVLAAAIFAVAMLMFVEGVSGKDFNTVITLISPDESAAGLSYPGPMAPIAAIIFASLGAAMASCDVRPGDKFYCNEAFASVALAVALTTLIGNACGENRLCTPAGCIVTNVATSVSYILASLAVLFLRPQYGVVSFILADTVAGMLMRRFVAGIIILPLLLWLRALGEKQGLYFPALGWTVFAVTVIGLLAGGTLAGLKVVARVERDREEKHRRLIDSSKRLAELNEQLSISRENKEKRLKHVCITCATEYDRATQNCPQCGAGLAKVTKKHFEGETFDGKYELKEFLGEGGMSAVYKAENLSVRKPVAIKVIHSRLSSDAQSIRRLQQEAKAAGGLNHPNLVHVFDFGITEEGEAYLVMELLTGRSLSDILHQEKRLAPEHVVLLFFEICAGLEYAHGHGIVHRDLKPSNVMLVREVGGLKVKIVDFGIARDLNVNESQRLTTTGEIIGSPPYMSPEQCSGIPLDARSDIYSLGCMLYECLAGRPPFIAGNVIALINMHLDADPEPFEPALQIPEYLQNIVFRTLRKEPKDRFQTVKQLREGLRSYSMKA